MKKILCHTDCYNELEEYVGTEWYYLPEDLKNISSIKREKPSIASDFAGEHIYQITVNQNYKLTEISAIILYGERNKNV